MRIYKCSDCGREKNLLINHDGLPEVWERCTGECMWGAKDGPFLYSTEGVKTGYRKRRFTFVRMATSDDGDAS